MFQNMSEGRKAMLSVVTLIVAIAVLVFFAQREDEKNRRVLGNLHGLQEGDFVTFVYEGTTWIVDKNPTKNPWTRVVYTKEGKRKTINLERLSRDRDSVHLIMKNQNPEGWEQTATWFFIQ